MMNKCNIGNIVKSGVGITVAYLLEPGPIGKSIVTVDAAFTAKNCFKKAKEVIRNKVKNYDNSKLNKVKIDSKHLRICKANISRVPKDPLDHLFDKTKIINPPINRKPIPTRHRYRYIKWEN